jgi:hypothetical protein
VQRDVGPGALARLIGGALRFDRETFRRSAASQGFTRLHLAVVLVAAISIGFATAMAAVAGGVVEEREAGLYRAIVLCWALACVLHFLLFVALAWLLQRVRRGAAMEFAPLTRLLALSVAPFCLTVLFAVFGYTPTNLATELVAGWLGPRGLFWMGSLLGYYPDDLTLLLGAWALAIGVVALRIGGGGSWTSATLTVLVAARLVGPLPEIADLVMNGLR